MNRSIALALALALPLTLAAQSMYKWVDEKGITHYSETPPPDNAQAKKVDVKPTPPSSARAADDASTWKDRAKELEKQRHERETSDEKGKLTTAQREKRCRDARIAEDKLVNVQGLYRYDEKGERHYFTDEERAAQMEKAKRIIAETC